MYVRLHFVRRLFDRAKKAWERLESDVALAMSLCDYEVHDVDGYIDIARAAVATVLMHDALAALVDPATMNEAVDQAAAHEACAVPR